MYRLNEMNACGIFGEYSSVNQEAAVTTADCRQSRFPFESIISQQQRLIETMEKDKPYLNPQLTLDTLAREIDIHRNTLSMLINRYCGSNYNDFINRYRIEEAKRIIDTSIKKRAFYKMWRIGAEAGFRSKSTFYRVFKRVVGCPPIKYKSRIK